MIPCTSCGAVWAADGFYTYKGEIIQPCRICRCDKVSVYYLNNAERLREKRRARYYAQLDKNRAREREYKRVARTAAATA